LERLRIVWKQQNGCSYRKWAKEDARGVYIKTEKNNTFLVIRIENVI
jgi:hypothetical protein